MLEDEDEPKLGVSSPGSDNEFLQLISSKIEHLRKKLVDGSRRNPLINIPFRANSRALIRFVDELPDILRFNLGQNMEMQLDALPGLDDTPPDEQTNEFLRALSSKIKTDEDYNTDLEQIDENAPDQEDQIERALRRLKDRIRQELGLPQRQSKDRPSLAEHAKLYGIRPDYNLPYPSDAHDDGRHEDSKIQTLLLPETLVRTAGALLQRAKSYENETGVNVLKTIIGILEWKPPEETKSFMSPIIEIETRISAEDSKTGKLFFIKGETPPTLNTSLQLKLSSEFGVTLSEYDGENIEDYLESLMNSAPPGWKWQVRREAAVGIFPSSKISMYRDIDPKITDVTNSEIIQSLLGTSSDTLFNYAETYEVDRPEFSKIIPGIVMDADASQFSALIDVASGKNIAIEGPPGSGKSQTIVNIIADAIRNGKTVLFVAEKLAALNVVKNRLGFVGLDEFILPLQAGKEAKARVYDSLRERVEAYSPRFSAQEYNDQVTKFDREKATLQEYLDILSQKFEATGTSFFDIIGKAIATSEIRSDLPRELRRDFSQQFKNFDDIAEILASVNNYEDLKKKLPKLSKIWANSYRIILNFDRAEDVALDCNFIFNEIKTFREKLSGDIFKQIPRPFNIDELEENLKKFIFDDELNIDIVIDILKNCKKQNIINDLYIFNNYIIAKNSFEKELVNTDLNSAIYDLEEVEQYFSNEKYLRSPNKYRSIISEKENIRSYIDNFRSEINNLPSVFSLHDYKLRDIITFLNLFFSHSEAARRDCVEVRSASPDLILLLRKDIENFERKIREIKVGCSQIAISMASNSKISEIKSAADVIENTSFLGRLGGTYKAAKAFFQNELGGGNKVRAADVVTQLRKAASVLEEIMTFKSSVSFQRAFGNLFNGIETNLDAIEFAVQAAEAIRTIPVHSSSDFTSLAQLRKENFEFLLNSSERANEVMVFHLNISKLPSLSEEISVQLDSAQKRLDASNKFWPKFNELKDDFVVDLDFIKKIKKNALALLDHQSDVKERLKRYPISKGDPGDESILQTLLYLRVIQPIQEMANYEFYVNVISQSGIDTVIEETRLLAEQAKTILEKVNLIQEEIEGSIPTGIWEIIDWQEEFDLAAQTPRTLIEYGRLRQVEKFLRENGVGAFLDWWCNADAAEVHAPTSEILEALMAKALADNLISSRLDAFQEYTGTTLNNLRTSISQRDKELIGAYKRLVKTDLMRNSAPPRGNSRGRKSSFTDLALINHQLGLQRPSTSLRELTRRANNALMELKPCWMMSPLAVAQYLPSGTKFDLVVIDEASQMTPENALGALRRAHQAVIVGDTKQLPPTNFFQKVLESEYEDEDIVEESESILDMANTSFSPVRQLRWHYRSRHEDLIRFSNHWMYDDKLTIFPSALSKQKDIGVFIKKIDGIYSNRTNLIEAQNVVQEILHHMKFNKNSSLGVCTMNTDQRDLIVEEFERERAGNKFVQEFLEHWERENEGIEEFFVKNLETIQGDERDTMIISTLYGPEKAGERVMQRFGPINSRFGHRRLNVLFTRAKSKILTITSLNSGDIISGDDKAKGVRMFKGWLDFCRTGSLPENISSGTETDSIFEDFVIRAIEKMGFEAVPQVGVAGFRIDIGVRHPKWPNGFLLGVECDGASYHSSRSARDRDRLRQEILENRGWTLHRIWSTDWFSDTSAEIERLKQTINERLNLLVAKDIANLSDDALVFNPSNKEEIEAVDTFVSVLQEEEGSYREASETINLGDTVRIRKLDGTNEELEVKILKNTSSVDDGVISSQSPMGRAIIGSGVGEIVEYVVGAYVKKIEIIKKL